MTTYELAMTLLFFIAAGALAYTLHLYHRDTRCLTHIPTGTPYVTLGSTTVYFLYNGGQDYTLMERCEL